MGDIIYLKSGIIYINMFVYLKCNFLVSFWYKEVSCRNVNILVIMCISFFLRKIVLLELFK